MEKRLTTGPIGRSLLTFSLPMILGNLLQQLYNVADTLIVGKTIGPTALSAVGSSYALMVLLTSMILGLCMGSGVVFSHLFGAGRLEELKTSIWNALVFVFLVSAAINGISYLLLEPCIVWLKVPAQAVAFTRTYLRIILAGMTFVSIYNFLASVLRSIGNTVVPLLFLAAAAVTNIVLDLVFILALDLGVAGAALATVIAQALSAIGVSLYVFVKAKDLCPRRQHRHYDRELLRKIISNSVLTSIQQSIMNFGILMVQGLVNSFGPVIMAAFAAAVKIDSFAYMPVQDFGNAFSTFIAQNYGAGEKERIRKGIRSAAACSMVFCLAVSAAVCLLARPLMGLFVSPAETQIIAAGMRYLRIEASFYCGIGLLFLLYGFYRAIQKPGVSVVLTVISLGTRVALAYALSAIPSIGVTGIWVSVPIGWLLADLAGILFYPFLSRRARKNASPALYR